MYETGLRLPSAVLIGVDNKYEAAKSSLEDLALLADTFGANVKKTFVQTLIMPDSKTFVGKGKLFEIKTFCEVEGIEIAIFDDDLTPSQTRNIEQALGIRVMDRSSLILEIFYKHARTAHAKVQVELARLEYMLPRLTRLWTHLERQRGGIGSKSGAGEKELETDKRIIKRRIALLKQELRKIEQVAATQRKHRSQMYRVTLVGYTNAGKSSLMNKLSKANVLSENKLFATLDTTVRRVKYEDTEFLLADTVGFIHKLPHHLIESFKSTLIEVKDADLLLHVVDVSHPLWERHVQVVKSTLEQLNAHHIPTILVLNKADLLSAEQLSEFDVIVNAYPEEYKLFLSSLENLNVNELKSLIVHYVRERVS